MAEENLGEFYVKIRADVSNLEKEVASLKAKLSRESTEMGKKLSFKAKFDNSIAVWRISELQKLREKLQREFDKKVSINVSSTSLDRTREKLAAVDARLRGVSESAEKTGGIFRSAFGKGLILAGGVTAFFSALKNSIKAAQESAIAQAQISQAIRTTGMAAGLTAKELFGMADELKKLTAIDDDTILTNITNNLLTFRNVSGDVFKRAQVAILDLNAVIAKGEIGALTSQTIQLGKALQSPTTGLMFLTRTGISFSEQQKKQIKLLAETGRLYEAQSLILDEIEKQYGGQAKILALNDGGFKKLNQSIDDVSEAIGNDLVGSATEGTGALQELADAFIEVNDVVKSVNGGVGLFGAIIDGLKNVITGGRGILDNAFNIKGLYKAAKTQYIKDMQEATKKTKEFYDTLGISVEPVKLTPLTPQLDTTAGDEILNQYTEQQTQIIQIKNKLNDVNLSTEQRIALEKELSSLLGTDKERKVTEIEKKIKKYKDDPTQDLKAKNIGIDKDSWEREKKIMFENTDLMKIKRGELVLYMEEVNQGMLDNSMFTTEAIMLDWVEKNRVIQDSLDVFSDVTMRAFDEIRIRAASNASAIENMFVDMGNIILQKLKEIAAEWAAMSFLRLIFGVATGGASMAVPVGHSGGNFIGTSSGVRKMAGGGSFIVPPGFPNDSYPLLVESGERVTVNPTSQTGMESRLLKSIDRKLAVLNSNTLEGQVNRTKQGAIPLYGKLEGQDIYISNKRAAKQIGRMS